MSKEVDVQAMFNSLKVDTQANQKNEEKIQPSLGQYGAAALLRTKSIDFGSTNPFTAKDMMDYFNVNGIRTGQICSGLDININRLSSMVKKADDGRDMSYEYISPTLEIFLRLLIAYPKYSPWRKITVQDVADITGFDIVSLAYICGSSDTAGERWGQDNNSTTPLVSVLLNLIYSMAKDGVDQVVFTQVADFVRNARNEHPTSRLMNDSCWNSEDEQVLRKVRKVLRNALNDLGLDGVESRLPNAQTSKIIKGLALAESDEIDSIVGDLKSRSSISGIKLEQSLHTIRLASYWIKARNNYQKAYVLFNRQKEELQNVPEAKLKELMSKKADEIYKEQDVQEKLNELVNYTNQLELHTQVTLQQER